MVRLSQGFVQSRVGDRVGDGQKTEEIETGLPRLIELLPTYLEALDTILPNKAITNNENRLGQPIALTPEGTTVRTFEAREERI